MLTCLVPVLFTFYIQGVIKLKKIIPASVRLMPSTPSKPISLTRIQILHSSLQLRHANSLLRSALSTQNFVRISLIPHTCHISLRITAFLPYSTVTHHSPIFSPLASKTTAVQDPTISYKFLLTVTVLLFICYCQLRRTLAFIGLN